MEDDNFAEELNKISQERESAINPEKSPFTRDIVIICSPKQKKAIADSFLQFVKESGYFTGKDILILANSKTKTAFNFPDGNFVRIIGIERNELFLLRGTRTKELYLVDADKYTYDEICEAFLPMLWRGSQQIYDLPFEWVPTPSHTNWIISSWYRILDQPKRYERWKSWMLEALDAFEEKHEGAWMELHYALDQIRKIIIEGHYVESEE